MYEIFCRKLKKQGLLLGVFSVAIKCTRFFLGTLCRLTYKPLLFQHLAHWGIDIASSEKTEKSMAEMELDINKSVGAEYAAIVESGAALKVSKIVILL